MEWRLSQGGEFKAALKLLPPNPWESRQLRASMPGEMSLLSVGNVSGLGRAVFTQTSGCSRSKGKLCEDYVGWECGPSSEAGRTAF